jgi:GT2 family glycosyltransferase
MRALSVQVIILNWNGWRDTLECVRSLRRHAGADLDILVVDNGSSDDSVATLRHEDPELSILETGRNLGFAAGNNAGIRSVLQHRLPDAFWLLNSDTVVEEATLPGLMAGLTANARVGAVGTVICDAKSPHHLQSWGGGWVSPWVGIPWACRGPRNRLNYLCGASLLLRTEALQQVGWLDEGFFFYFEDADYSFRLRQAGWLLSVAPDARVFHRGGGSIGSQSEQAARLYRISLIRFLRKHSRFPLVPALFTTALRLAIAGMKGQTGVVRGTLAGWREGWRAAR